MRGTWRNAVLRIGIFVGCLVFVIACVACGKKAGDSGTSQNGASQNGGDASQEQLYDVSTDETGSVTYVPVSSGSKSGGGYTVSVDGNGSKTYVSASSRNNGGASSVNVGGEDAIDWEDLADDGGNNITGSAGGSSKPVDNSSVVADSSSVAVAGGSSVAQPSSKMPVNSEQDSGWGPWVKVK